MGNSHTINKNDVRSWLRKRSRRRISDEANGGTIADDVTSLNGSKYREEGSFSLINISISSYCVQAKSPVLNNWSLVKDDGEFLVVMDA